MTPAEQRYQYFATWEKRGRGFYFWRHPVLPEPPFAPFLPPQYQHFNYKDDSLIQNLNWKGKLFNKVQNKWFGNINSGQSPEPVKNEPEENLEPTFVQPFGYEIKELQLRFPKKYVPNHFALEQCLVMTRSQFPVSFEIIGMATEIVIQFACHKVDVDRLRAQLEAYFPEVIIVSKEYYLLERMEEDNHSYCIEFALDEEFMRPLNMLEKSSNIDFFTGIMATLEKLGEKESGILQVLFQKARHNWTPHILASVTGEPGKSFFEDGPEMFKLAEVKTAHPLYAVIIRVIGLAETENRLMQILHDLERSVMTITQSMHNSLTVLEPLEDIVIDENDYSVYNDILYRKTRRSGMLLNSKELLSLVHFPSPLIQVSKLRQHIGKTKKAPSTVFNHPCVIGINTSDGIETEVSLSTAHRLRHTHVIGATGTGKSTLLKRLIIQDINAGGGLLVLDPHGDLIDDIIPFVPENRFDDVVVINPADVEYPIGFNLLSAHSEVEKIILSGDLVALFKRLSTSWGDQMHTILANAILAFLENEEGGTLLDLRRFLVESSFRNNYLENVADSSIQYFWEQEFPMLRKDAAAPLVTRLDTFLRTRILRNMMVQKEGLDLGDLMKKQKIVFIKLSQGLIGKENSYLLGTLFVTKLNQVAHARQTIHAAQRTPFYLYIDEFQNFITPSMEEILSGARKYGLGMVLAHQGLSQLKNDRQVGDAVIANAGTRICFRVGDDDARILERGFSDFEANDLQRLSVGEAVIRVGQIDHDFNLSTQMLEPIEENIAKGRVEAIIKKSRAKYSKPREEVEALWQYNQTQSTPKKKKAKEKPAKAKSVETNLEPSHRNIQKTIQRIGEAHGFKSVIEELTENGQVDVGLTKNGLRIACEISIKNKPEYEIQSIQKRFSTGYHFVIMTSPDLKHLSKIKQLAEQRLSIELRTKTHFIQISDIDSLLEKLKTEPPSPNQVRGYKVESEFPEENSNDFEIDDSFITDDLFD